MIDRKLLALAKGNGRYIVAIVACNWLSMLVNVYMIALFAHFIAGWYTETLTSADFMPFLVQIGFGLLIRLVLMRLGAYFSWRASAGIKGRLRSVLYHKILKLDLGYMQDVSTSEVVQVATEGIDQLEIYFGRYLPQLFYSLLAPLTLFVILLPVAWHVAVALLVCVPLIPVSIVAVQKFAKKLLSKYWNSYTSLGDGFLENIQGLTTLKIYEADEAKQKEMNERAEEFRQVTMKVLMMQLNSITVMDIVAYGGAGLGIVLALFANLSLAAKILIILVSSEFFLPLRLLGSYFHIAMNGMAASKKLFRIIELDEPARGNGAVQGPLTDLQAKDMSFAYQVDQPVLKDISFHACQGEMIALVGASGCGKSTLAKLILGKHVPDDGSLVANGKSIWDYDRDQWLNTVVYLGHDDYLFKGTVEECLKMACPNATTAQMWEVLEKVNMKGFLTSEQGLQTKLNERASNLSGGQRQRLCLARALLKDGSVYIFDEATSNIDVESEETIMQVIEEMAKNKIVILISHRLSIVTQAKDIYYMENGQILEKGSHSELMAKNGAYAHLFKTQYDLENYMKGDVVA